jgi:hypothetical protein
MRAVVLAIIALGCEPRLPPQPLPELVAPRGPAQPIPMSTVRFARGERMVWEVYLQGLSLGRAELVVGDREVRSEFATQNILVTMRHELATALDRGQPAGGTDVLVVNGSTRRNAVPPGVHTLHSVIGWMRTWARPGARGGYLTVASAGKLYRLEVGDPVEESLKTGPALKVDCQVVPPSDAPIPVTVWLSRDHDLVPIRVQVVDDDLRVTAELVDYHVE